MRIIGGEARGRTLVAPAGQNTRPTQDYVRESLFNILSPRLSEAVVLDLFAGTGALALEAISRGAAHATLVDRDRAALAAIRKNIEAVRCAERCRVIAADYKAALSILMRASERFTLIFLDPPYRMEETGSICARLLEDGLLADDFLLVVEHRRNQGPVLDARFAVRDVRHYGDTEISFVCAAEGGSAEDEDAAVRGEF